jgi:hypothetical protein
VLETLRKVLNECRIYRGGDTNSAVHSRWCQCPSIHHASQLAQHRPVPAHRH